MLLQEEREGSRSKEIERTQDAAAAVEAILNSATFHKAPTLRKLLQYLWENRHEDPGEYAIATEALGRKADFDPKTDSAVRVHTLRLRQKLKEYYEGEGAGSLIRLSLPHGSHRMELEWVEPRVDPADERSRRTLDVRWIIGGFAAVLFLAVVVDNVRLRQRPAAGPGELPRFWSSLFADGRPARIVLPTPLFLQWPGGHLRVRDYRINEFSRIHESDELAPLLERLGAPILSQSYSVMTDALAAATLARFLAPLGGKLAVVPDSQLSLDTFADHHVVFLGIPNTSQYLKQFLQRANFELVSSGASVANRAPRPGEPSQYDSQNHSESRQVRPALLALYPGKAPGTRILLLGGHSLSLASLLTSPSGLEAVDAVWEENGSPAYFEMVVMAEIEGQIPLRVRPAGFRPVPVNR
jgi:hypothetical protein